MKRWLAAAALVVGLFAPSHATADSYSYGGSGKRFTLSVWLLGFNEGAGAGGWDEESARDFAGWAARFDAAIPQHAKVELVKDVNDDDTRLTLRVAGRSEVAHFPGEVDLDLALRWVAKRFHRPIPPSRRARLFTLQLFASRSAANAEHFVERLEARGVRASRAIYHAACHPCSIPEARVLTDASSKIHRVVIGVFAERHTAREALTEIRRRWRLEGLVREL